MAEQPCLAQVQACMIRVAKLNATTGAPVAGASQGYISDALVSVAFEPEYVDGAEITQDNACGNRVIDYRAPDQFRRGNVTIQLATPDPYLSALLSGGTVLTGSGGDAGRIGFAAPPLGVLNTTPISVELWAKRPDMATGGLDADSPYAKWVYPLIRDLRLVGYTQENGPFLPSFTGRAFENDNWGNGPWNDWLAASDRVFQWMPTATMPTAACGPATVPAQT